MTTRAFTYVAPAEEFEAIVLPHFGTLELAALDRAFDIAGARLDVEAATLGVEVDWSGFTSSRPEPALPATLAALDANPGSSVYLFEGGLSDGSRAVIDVVVLP